MADKEKKVADSKADETVSEESKAAEKVAKAAKGSGKKSDKPNVFSRMGKGMKKFFKDFKGESKKIVWPDAKTVLKSTGVVILVVAIVAVIIFGIDAALSSGVSGLKQLAKHDEETTTSAVAGETTDNAKESETEAAKETKADDAETQESTTQEETTAADAE